MGERTAQFLLDGGRDGLARLVIDPNHLLGMAMLARPCSVP